MIHVATEMLLKPQPLTNCCFLVTAMLSGPLVGRTSSELDVIAATPTDALTYALGVLHVSGTPQARGYTRAEGATTYNYELGPWKFRVEALDSAAVRFARDGA